MNLLFSANKQSKAARLIKQRIGQGLPVTTFIGSDSTANGIDEWYNLLMKAIADKYRSHSYLPRTWSDTTQSYSSLWSQAYSTTGVNGEAYIGFPGTKNYYLTTPDKASLRITGDLDVSIRFSMTDFTPSVIQDLVFKMGNAGNRGWGVYITTSGRPTLWWSANGTDLLTATADSATGAADGSVYELRVTLDVDNGSGGYTVTFYSSTNHGITWTQFGSAITTTSGTTSLYASTNPMNIGCRYANQTNVLSGKVYYAYVRNGIDGPVVASPHAGLAFPSTITSFTDVEGNVWSPYSSSTAPTFGNGSPLILALNGAVSGQTIDYDTDATRFALLTAKEPDVSFISFGHNEGASTDYTAKADTLPAALLAKYPNTKIVYSTQNPNVSPAANITEHGIRQEQVRALIIEKKYDLIDAYRKFMGYGATPLIQANGLHPNAAGSQFWLGVARKDLGI